MAATKITIELKNSNGDVIGELDVSKNLPFGVTYSIDDIKDPTKRNSAFSKTIKLPGTKNNNFLFGSLFDVNSDFTFFNPNIKTNAKIILDSTTVLDGYLQLRKIDILKNNDLQGNEITYDVVIFDSVVDIFKDIGVKEISELDFSDFDHLYSLGNIQDSWNNTSPDIFGYPMLYNNTDNYKTKNFKPGIFHKAYLKKIAEDSGISLGGTFMDNTDYERDIIPFNGKIPELDATEIQRRLFQAGMSTSAVTLTTLTLLGGVTNNNGATFANQVNSPVTFFTDDTTSPNFDPNGHWNPGTNTWSIDRNGSYNLFADFIIDVEFKTIRDIISISDGGGSSIIINSPNHQLPTGLNVFITGTTSYNGTRPITIVDANNFKMSGIAFVANESGQYAWECYESTYSVNSYQTQPGTEIFPILHGNWKYKIIIEFQKNGNILANFNGVETQVPRGSNFQVPPKPITSNFPLFTDASTFNVDNGFSKTTEFNISGVKTGLSLTINDEITMSHKISNGSNNAFLKYTDRNTNLSSARSVPVDVIVTSKENNIAGTNTSKVFNQANNAAVTDGDTIFLNEYIPKKFKQKDIFIDLIKRYNLYIQVDPNNNRRLLLNTRNEFYKQGTTLDWTQKKDYSTKDKIQLLSELQNKEMKFTYKPDTTDFLNNRYTEQTEEVYGQKTIDFSNEFIKGTKLVESPFSPTPLKYNSINNTMIVSSIDSVEPKIKIRVLHYAGLKDTLNNNTWTITSIDSGGTQVVTTLSQYPYAGHFDDPINPTLDINFGELPFTYYSELLTKTNNNLFNNHWRDYLNQIAEGKLITSKFYLTPVDIGFIKDNLNSKIFVKDSFYFINKIENYDPTSDGLTTVSLLKINEGVDFVEEITSRITTATPYEANISANLGGDFGGVTTTGTQTGYRNDNTTNSELVNFSGKDNYVGINSDRTMVIGDDNVIGDNVNDSGILGGDGNIIESRINNSWVIGANNKTITRDNEIFIGEGLHIVDGDIQSKINLIDGGSDSLSQLFPIRTLINQVEGGENELRSTDITNTLNLIDGGEDSL